jgi:hypothetical protein
MIAVALAPACADVDGSDGGESNIVAFSHGIVGMRGTIPASSTPVGSVSKIKRRTSKRQVRGGLAMSATSQINYASPLSGPIDVRAVRYPTEPSRFALAAVSVVSALAVVVVWMAVIDLESLLLGVISLLIGMVAIWVALQIHRLRILGDAVLVTSETLPHIQSAIDEVRHRVGYHRRVDIFVVPKSSKPVTLTSYFGVRVLIVEGRAVADITAPATRPQLLFLLGTYFGALKAKHDRWAVVEMIIDRAGVRKILAPFVGPWLRATAYTGDQIAYVCSRDLGTSLDAVFRALVGREMSPQLEAAGVLKQAERVRTSWLLRFSQLFRPVPHATNRFLNVLRFAARLEPETVWGFRATLPENARTSLDTMLARAVRDEQRRFGAAVLTCFAVATGAFLCYAGLRAADTSETLPPDFDESSPAPVEPIPTTPETAPPPTVPIPTPAEELAEAVPVSLGVACVEIAEPPADFFEVHAAVTCEGLSPADADRADIYSFDSSVAMSAATDAYLGDLGDGACEDGLRGTWSSDDVYRGTLGCYVAPNGNTTAVWTIDDEAILIVAGDPNMALPEMYDWWSQATPASLLFG